MQNILKALLVVLFSGLVYSQTLIETGFLRNTSGQPISGAYPMKFKIYTQDTGGSPVWDSGFLTVTVNDGLYTVRLGENPQPTLDEYVLTNSGNYYMEFEVDGDTFLTRELIAYHARAILADKSIHSDLAVTANFAFLTDAATTANYAVTANYAAVAGIALSAPSAGFANTANYSLDADQLDGQHGSYYLNASNINAGVLSSSYLPVEAITNNYSGDVSINGNVNLNGAISEKMAIQQVGNFTIAATDRVVVVSASATVSLPSAAVSVGRKLLIKNMTPDNSLVTLAVSGAETIDGWLAYTLYLKKEFVEIMSDGSNWVVIGRN